MLDQETYIKDRVEGQIKWYSNKSSAAQKRYKLFKVITLLCAVLIPFLTGLLEEIFWMKYVIGTLGVAIAAVEGIQSLYKNRELWLEYRGTSEALKREKLLFQTLSGDYTEAADPFKLFVLKSEEIMAGEQSGWKEYIAKMENGDGK
ncbi:MAG TPA: DUF4231 domain-containing protein [Saprospiraceae bacterium]|nr:DUF4231 domain-containing protein [Saprospiraceae bacterium]